MADELEMGYQSALYINTGTYETPVWSELDIVRDVSSLDAVDKVDLTTRGTARLGYKASGYGLREKGWSSDSLVPAAGETNLAYDALITAQNAREPVDVLHVEGGVISTDGLPATRAVCGVFGGAKAEPVGGEASSRAFELSFIQNSDQGVPVNGTTSGSAFVPSS